MDQLSTKYLSYSQKLLLYIQYRKDFLNVYGIFADETENFRSPSCPLSGESVTIKLRCGKNNVDNVLIHFGGTRHEMVKSYQEEIFDYYTFDTITPSELTYYYYELIKNGESYFYNKKGLSRHAEQDYNFLLIPDFKTPDWAKGAVIYQIFIDRFCNGDALNDVVSNEYIYLGKPVKKIDDWETFPSTDDIRNFYGGDLQGILDKIPYLKDLGIDVIYLNPVFVSPSNHKYDIQDYDHIDPHIGAIVKDNGEPLRFEKFKNRYASMYIERTTDMENLRASDDLFEKLLETAHQNGIRVIIDGVFNHCGAFNKWLDRENFYSKSGYPQGAYRAKESIYHDFFRWYDNENWPNNDAYDGWWGLDNHPKLNYEQSDVLYEYILSIARKWISPPFNADGWRLDVAADLGYSREFNHKFWRDYRKAVKEANSDAIILAEHYGDPREWLLGDQWDTVMNYDAFMEPISWFLTGLEKHSDEFKSDMLCNVKAFENAMRYHMSKFSIQSLQTSMNQLSNHDHSRFLSRTNMSIGRLHTKGSRAASEGINKGIMKEAVTFQMTWPGSPAIYYGDEAGLCGWTDPDNRRTFPWGKEDQDLLSFHKELIKIHKRYDAIKTGSLEYLTMEYGFLSYGRFNDINKIFVALNNNNFKKLIKIPIWRIGVKLNSKMKLLVQSDETGYTTAEHFYDVKDGIMEVELPKLSSIVMIEV